MLEILYSFISPFLGYIVTALGAVAAVAAIWAKGRSDGVQSERNKALKEAYNAERNRDNIEDRVRNAGDDDFERLRNKWIRPD